MTLKAITTLLFACLVIHQTFGCLNEIVRDDFNSMDKDQSGFLTRNEVFEACSSESISEKECEKGWKSMDLNNDGQVICQGMSQCLKIIEKVSCIWHLTESFVGALAMIEGLQSWKVGETFRRIFADKPENCDEVSKEEVEKLLQFVENFQIYLDANQDGIITCYGTQINTLQISFFYSYFVFL